MLSLHPPRNFHVHCNNSIMERHVIEENEPVQSPRVSGLFIKTLNNVPVDTETKT